MRTHISMHWTLAALLGVFIGGCADDDSRLTTTEDAGSEATDDQAEDSAQSGDASATDDGDGGSNGSGAEGGSSGSGAEGGSSGVGATSGSGGSAGTQSVGGEAGAGGTPVGGVGGIAGQGGTGGLGAGGSIGDGGTAGLDSGVGMGGGGGQGGAGGAGGEVESDAGTPFDAIDESEVQDALAVNELYFEYQDLIGTSIWVHGVYGDARHNDDGMGFVVDNVLRLFADEQMPHHSFARLSGDLPPSDWNESEVLLYGEIQDFATATGLYSIEPIPLITVADAIQLSPPISNPSWDDSLGYDDSVLSSRIQPGSEGGQSPLPPDLGFETNGSTLPGNMAEPCDRSVIISGGIDVHRNHRRYRDNVVAKFSKMQELGFSDEQIEVFYNDGGAIDLDGTNITDHGASKQDIQDHFAALASELPGSCTLTVFVTDHGTGYNPSQGYQGARPVFSGPDVTGGFGYHEAGFKLDAGEKVTRRQTFRHNSNLYSVTRNASGQIQVHQRSGHSWVLVGRDTDGDGRFTESEANVDFDGDGTLSTRGFSGLERFADIPPLYGSNAWDTDRDGVLDVRLRWDAIGMRYVAERLIGGTWVEMGRDVDGDFVIDVSDGGVDWDLDGDTDDFVNFQEGINLWGSDVLWDDEFVDLLRPLREAGVHILVEMVSCFAGGFVQQLEDVVENVVTGSTEETKHFNRKDALGNMYAADELAFLDNLQGIDSASWSAAWDAAIIADDMAAAMETGAAATPNEHHRWETRRIQTPSVFEEHAPGDYALEVAVDPNLEGDVYDFEIIYGLQVPRWPVGGFPDGLPDGLMQEEIPGGVRVYSETPLPNPVRVRVLGAPGTQTIRVGLTDVNHESFGYTMATPGSVPLPVLAHVAAMTGSFSHSTGFSTVFGTVTIRDANGNPVPGAIVTLAMNGVTRPPLTTNAQGVANFSYTITQFGTYTVSVQGVNQPNGDFTYVPADNVVSQVTVVVN